MTESNQPFASSRYLLWDKPLAYPFYDIIHRDTNPGKVFDLAIDLDSYDGSVYIKTQDIVEMARTLGMLTKEDAEKLREENKELRRQINKLPVAQEDLKRGLDDLTAKFFVSLNTLDSESNAGSVDESQNDRESAEPEQSSVKPFSF